MKQFDFLVLGSGIAGLTFALQAAARGRVAIITKKNRADSNTNWAQGGIAAVTSREDSVEMHVRDTLTAGAGLCKEADVRPIIRGRKRGVEGECGRVLFRSAQGGIAAVTSREDSVEMHVRDTLTAGAGLCKEAIVRTII